MIFWGENADFAWATKGPGITDMNMVIGLEKAERATMKPSGKDVLWIRHFFPSCILLNSHEWIL
jgi:hypothetical protein